MNASCNVAIIGAGPYGLSCAAYLRSGGIETHVFGEPMSFWESQMPVGMHLRSNWGATHIADPNGQLTLDAFCHQNGNHIGRPIPIERFIAYGNWFQHNVVPDLDRRQVGKIEKSDGSFRLSLENGDVFTASRVIVAAGISDFATRPRVFNGLSLHLASHSSEQRELGKFKGQRVVIVGAGQSALESAALLHEAGTEVEVIARRERLNWVGLHPELHKLGFVSKLLYSDRDVGPAGISRLVAMPHLFRRFPRAFQSRVAYRAIRPAVAGWLKSRLQNVPITFGREIVSAKPKGSGILLLLNDGTERTADHVLLATGYKVEISRYKFLSDSLVEHIRTREGYPVLKRGMESSVPGLHFVGKPAAWSFGPLLGFVSGAQFASQEILSAMAKRN